EKIAAKDFYELTGNEKSFPEDAVLEIPKGMYARTTILKGSVLQKSALSERSLGTSDVLSAIPDGYLALSVSIKSMAQGVSGKIGNGDTVAVFLQSDSGYRCPLSLSEVRVITTTTSSGADADETEKDSEGKIPLPSSVTLLVTPEQASLLIEAEEKGRIYLALVRKAESGR
ncbi:MAG: hypothetical protein II797_03860, partial [Clostridia bacterium]|nr:hypothetical protein [Clostridia bacterium]